MSGTLPRRMNLTKRVVDALRAPASGRYYVYDANRSAPQGLAVCVTDRGVKTWYRVRRVGSKSCRERLGRFPGLSVEGARTAAAIDAAKIATGIDPAEERRSKAGDPSLGEAFERFLTLPASRAGRPKRPRTVSEYRRQWETFLAPWANRALSAISEDDVVVLHRRITDRTTKNAGGEPVGGPYIANRVVALLSAVYGAAKRNPKARYHGANPADAVDRNSEKGRVRYLTAEETRRFLAAVEVERNVILRDLVLMAFYTGARRANVCSMRWVDLDLDGQVWTIPADDAKAGESIHVVLTAEAVKILRARRKAASEAETSSEWVFPARRGGGHVVEPKSAMTRILKSAGITGVRFHDLRHNLASTLVNEGVSLTVVGKQLGHRSIATTMKYAHVDLTATKQAMNAMSAAVNRALAKKTGSDE